jgi:C4-type Zn-finger protein
MIDNGFITGTSTKDCPVCHAKMILIETGEVLMSSPEQYVRKWWCGCGYREDAPRRVAVEAEDATMALWRKANAR